MGAMWRGAGGGGGVGAAVASRGPARAWLRVLLRCSSVVGGDPPGRGRRVGGVQASGRNVCPREAGELRRMVPRFREINTRTRMVAT